MRALLSFIVGTTSFGLSLLAGVAAVAEPFNWSLQVDDPIHTPAELVESMHSAFRLNTIVELSRPKINEIVT